MVFSATLGPDTGSRGAIQWSLSGTRGSRSCGGLQCHMRGYKGSGSAIQWSLSGNIRTWGGLQTSVLHEGLYNRLYIYGCYSMVSEWY